VIAGSVPAAPRPGEGDIIRAYGGSKLKADGAADIVNYPMEPVDPG
jgi:hypothetical protein